jgi:osmoprotectant transport system permease protein
VTTTVTSAAKKPSDAHATWTWLTDGTNWHGAAGIPTRLGEHLQTSLVALLIAMAIALPLGIVLGHFGRGGFLAVNLGNIGRAVPTFGLLVIFASWSVIGVGNKAAWLALALFAVPPMLTNSYVGMRGVDPEVKDAARGMGMTGWQMLRRVELPLAVPLVFAGFRTAAVQVVATATLAALVAGGGLGRFVVDGQATHDNGELYGGAVVIAVLCIGLELILGRVQRGIDPARRGKVSRRAAAPVAPDLVEAGQS